MSVHAVASCCTTLAPLINTGHRVCLTSRFGCSSSVDASLFLQLLRSERFSSCRSCTTLLPRSSSDLVTLISGGTKRTETKGKMFLRLWTGVPRRSVRHFLGLWEQAGQEKGSPAKCSAYVHRKGALFMQASHTISWSSSGSSTQQPRCCQQTMPSTHKCKTKSIRLKTFLFSIRSLLNARF